jgi:uncharacterized protein YeeX (DUF496 family)
MEKDKFTDLPIEEQGELQDISQKWREATDRYLMLANLDEEQKQRVSSLSLEEINTRYQILFDIHQEIVKVKRRVDLLENFKQGRNYAPFIHTIDGLTTSISEQLNELLGISFKKISDRGFL